MRKLIPLSILALILGAASLQAQTCEPDAIPPFTCNFNCWSAVISGSRAYVTPGTTGPVTFYAVSLNSLCGSCGADPNGPPCGYATRAEALQCVDFYVRHGVPVPRNNPRQMVDVYPYLGGYVLGPEGFPPPGLDGYPWPDTKE